MQKLINRLRRINWRIILLKITKLLIVILILAITGPIILHCSIKSSQKDQIYQKIEDLPQRKVAIVFGTASEEENIPSQLLKDRIQTAFNLYNAGKVEKILMSGDDRFNETSTMINYAIELGIPRTALQGDYAASRTYDTCYRAKYNFDLDEAILVTQDFHLTRALYICNALDVDSVGIAADITKYPNTVYMQIRDIYALALALWDVNIRKPPVVLGDQIEI